MPQEKSKPPKRINEEFQDTESESVLNVLKRGLKEAAASGKFGTKAKMSATMESSYERKRRSGK